MSFSPSIHSPLHLIREAIATYLPSSSRPCSNTSEIDPIFNLADFDVDYNTGFLSSQHPISRLPEEYDLWESALASANESLSLGEDNSPEALAKRESSSLWRLNLESAPVLCIKSLQRDVSLLQRAHHVLAFLVHFYVHSITPSSTTQIRVPASLAVPLVAVSEILGIAPILTFADTVLWNYELIDESQPLSPTNMRAQTLFTGTIDEQKFYLCCASIEMQGVRALRVISDFQNVDIDDLDSTALSEIASSLDHVASVIDELTSTLKSVRCGCDPHVFYDQIRPWFRGSDASGPNSPRWLYEGVPNSDKLELSGPSAGQSSMIHSLDVFFDVDHKLEQDRLPAPSEQNRRADHTFMTRMRRYMPGKHQKFLIHLASSPRSIRDLAIREPSLQQSYNNCVLGLKKFRDAHLRIACLYVVSMSRSKVALKAGCPVGAMMVKMEEEAEAAKRQPVRGTGGNELSLLLKACRDATTRTLLQ